VPVKRVVYYSVKIRIKSDGSGVENVRNARWRAALDLNVVLAMPNLI
jgi:hypothetical protein